jgi:hypothetical protein
VAERFGGNSEALRNLPPLAFHMKQSMKHAGAGG